MSRPVLQARFSNLSSEQQEALRQWFKGVQDPDAEDSKIGLWVCGPRGGGSSYVAEVAVAKYSREYEGDPWEHVTALQLVDSVRRVWSMGDLLRRNPDDYALFQDLREIEDEQDYLWGPRCGLLWIDDLHHEAIDTNFWRKHVQERVEQRIKAVLPTVVATTWHRTILR